MSVTPERVEAIVGSTSQHKLGAVRDAYDLLGVAAEVVGVAAASGVPEQPVGLDQIATGALNRAEAAAREARSSGFGSVVVGIESGLVRAHLLWIDIAVAVVRTPLSVRIATSSGIVVPRGAVERADALGFAVNTAGQELAKLTGSDPADFVTYLTDGRMTRRQQVGQAVYMALIQKGR